MGVASHLLSRWCSYIHHGEILANSKPSWRCRKPRRKTVGFPTSQNCSFLGEFLVSWSTVVFIGIYVYSFCKMPCLSSSVFLGGNKPDRGFREVCHDRLYRYVWLHMQIRPLLSDQPSPWSSKYLDWKEIDLMMPSIQRLKNFHFVRSCQFKKKSKHKSIKILTLRTIFMCLSNQEKVSKYIPNTRSWVGMKHVKSLLIFGSFLGPWNPYQIPTVFFHRWLIRTSHSYPSSSPTQAGSFIHPTFS